MLESYREFLSFSWCDDRSFSLRALLLLHDSCSTSPPLAIKLETHTREPPIPNSPDLASTRLGECRPPEPLHPRVYLLWMKAGNQVFGSDRRDCSLSFFLDWTNTAWWSLCGTRTALHIKRNDYNNNAMSTSVNSKYATDAFHLLFLTVLISFIYMILMLGSHLKPISVVTNLPVTF